MPNSPPRQSHAKGARGRHRLNSRDTSCCGGMPRQLLGEVVQNIWAACAMAHCGTMRETAVADDIAAPAILATAALHAQRASPGLA